MKFHANGRLATYNSHVDLSEAFVNMNKWVKDNVSDNSQRSEIEPMPENEFVRDCIILFRDETV